MDEALTESIVLWAFVEGGGQTKVFLLEFRFIWSSDSPFKTLTKNPTCLFSLELLNLYILSFFLPRMFWQRIPIVKKNSLHSHFQEDLTGVIERCKWKAGQGFRSFLWESNGSVEIIEDVKKFFSHLKIEILVSHSIL